MKISPLIVAFTLGVIAPAKATPTYAYLYEMHVSGSFGTTIHPDISNLPDSTYPFPQMRSGSFDGTFVYDSMASQSPGSGFPSVSVNINLFDNTGVIASTITSAPFGFFVDNNTAGVDDILWLHFGLPGGAPNTIENLVLAFNGNFGNPNSITPPSPHKMTAASWLFGYLETDGDDGSSSSLTYWDLPVTSASITHSGTTSYIQNVPDAGSTISLLGLSLAGLFAAGRTLRIKLWED